MSTRTSSLTFLRFSSLFVSVLKIQSSNGAAVTTALVVIKGCRVTINYLFGKKCKTAFSNKPRRSVGCVCVGSKIILNFSVKLNEPLHGSFPCPGIGLCRIALVARNTNWIFSTDQKLFLKGQGEFLELYECDLNWWKPDLRNTNYYVFSKGFIELRVETIHDFVWNISLELAKSNVVVYVDQ